MAVASCFRDVSTSRMRQLISETSWGQRGQLGVNIREAGVVDHAFRN